MKSSTAKSVLLAATLSSTSVLSIAQSVVYRNIANDSGQFYSSVNQFGDEITLAGTDRTLFNVKFEYYYNGATPGNITLRLYANTGTGGAPGTPLLGSPSVFPLDTTLAANGNRGTFTWNLSSASPLVTVPDTFTWTVEFSNLSGTAGLLGFGPLPIGTSPNDFLAFVGGNWQN